MAKILTKQFETNLGKNPQTKVDITLLDGSIGQELVKRARDQPTALWSTQVMIDSPGLVRELHADYFTAGATIATTNTYAVNADRFKQADRKYNIEALWNVAMEAACNARDFHGQGRVAGSIGPLVASFRPDLCPPVAEAITRYESIVAALSMRVDMLLIESMSSVEQADGALSATDKSEKPVWMAVTLSDHDGTKLRSGEPLTELAPMLNGHNLQAILINCSRPEVIEDGLCTLKEFGLPYGAYANGFTEISVDFLKDSPTVDSLETRVDLTPEKYADFVLRWVEQGATIVGGCCEVGPDHIAYLAARLAAAGYKVV